MSERKTFFANILIPVPIHEVFTYRIPFEMNGHVMFGQRVIVPFGKSKLQTGIIVEIHERIPTGARCLSVSRAKRDLAYRQWG